MLRTLVVNAGSSTLKLSVVRPDDSVRASLTVASGDFGALQRFCAEHGPVEASGHRIVHGGGLFVRPVVLDDDVLSRIEALAPLAPLHQRAGVEGVRLVRRLEPDLPAVACFDTAFHATLPEAATTYALPATWRQNWGLRRFGFHGLSHQWASARALELTGRPVAGSRVVVCHLGAGSSLCAVRDGRSVDTTMGFTPLEGLVMATRSGTVDPGLVLWVIRAGGLDPDEVEDALEHRSGLAGLSGTDGDMRTVMSASAAGSVDAARAVDVWLHRLRQAIAAMVAALDGLDVLVFTGGIGEHQPELRARTVDGLGFLGLAVDRSANAAAAGDADISAGGSGRVVVVSAREDVQIARLVRGLLSAP